MGVYEWAKVSYNVDVRAVGEGRLADEFGLVWDRTAVDKDLGVVQSYHLPEPDLDGYEFREPDVATASDRHSGAASALNGRCRSNQQVDDGRPGRRWRLHRRPDASRSWQCAPQNFYTRWSSHDRIEFHYSFQPDRLALQGVCMKRLSLLPGTVVTAAILSTLISCPQGLINNPKLSAFPHRGPAPLTVDFKVYQADDYEAFEWIPGDGTRLIATDSDTFTHIYESPGTYYACCFTYDNESPDFDDGSYATITVTEPGFAASIETESVDAEYCYTPEGFQVVFSSSVSGGEPPYTYSWDFGDGVRSSSEDNPMYHQYFPEGPGESYTVRLRVTDSTTAVVDSNEITIDVNECAVVGL